jgi:glycosyltransferase involved in cell wall biosynthesis
MRQGSLNGRRGRIAVLFPAFLGGGAEAVCLWMLEALKGDFQLSLHTFSRIDFAGLDRYYGTHLADARVQVVQPFAGAAFSRLLAGSHRLYTLRQHLLIRHLKRLRDPCDLRISAFNEMDLGAPGIQYIHFPFFGRGHERARGEVQAPDSPLRAAYRGACRLLSRFSERRMRENLTIANSHWTAGILRRVYGLEPRVVYPPVSGRFPRIPWERKRSGFIVVGRIVPEKRVETALAIVGRLRREGHALEVCVAGRASSPAYLSRLRRLARDSGPWASIRTDLSREELCALMAGYRYGLHARENEQFGIGVAEMLAAGCLPFVSSRGGQTEVVGGREALLFDSPDQAVERIGRVLADEGLERRLRAELQDRARLFSAERFMAEIAAAVREYLAA